MNKGRKKLFASVCLVVVGVALVTLYYWLIFMPSDQTPTFMVVVVFLLDAAGIVYLWLTLNFVASGSNAVARLKFATVCLVAAAALVPILTMYGRMAPSNTNKHVDKWLREENSLAEKFEAGQLDIAEYLIMAAEARLRVGDPSWTERTILHALCSAQINGAKVFVVREFWPSPELRALAPQGVKFRLTRRGTAVDWSDYSDPCAALGFN